MIVYDLPFILLHVAVLSTLVFLIYIVTIRNKKTLHYLFIGVVIVAFVWTGIALLQVYSKALLNYSGMLLTNIYFSAAGFVSFFLFYIGFVFKNSHKTLKPRHYALFIFPVCNAAMIWTDNVHHLYFTRFSEISSEIIRGPYFNAELVVSYAVVLMGLYFLVSFTIKNSGFFSRQSILIIVGTLGPVFADVVIVARLFKVPIYFEPISFSFGIICFSIAIFRFDFLNIVPVALQTIVDHISDSYLVLNERMEITDYNRTFVENFSAVTAIRRKEPFGALFKGKLSEKSAEIICKIDNSIKNQKLESYEVHFEEQKFNKFFIVEITPVASGGTVICTIVLFKDITEQKRDAELIARTQVALIESEHLASLGQLVGGIAHNLKTPIMSIAGGLEGLTDLIDEYDESVGDPGITAEDHHEIAGDMRVWIRKMKEYASYMSDIISAVKGQAVQLTSTTTDSFTLRELIKRVEILMNHELKRYCCRLDVSCALDPDFLMKGEINSFIQVVNNLIINAIEAYEGKEGVIELNISRTSQDSQMVLFEVRDSGSGMTDEVQEKLFKEMITTKAKNGTGLGLYMSYSTITGRFGGKMWFRSVHGMGTSFYIMIPAA
ncbi:Signal transduction histidine kinase [Sporobacter termitidis DSM 10068]|uniref:histidine kinase n=1 Tax=Sporobacter termitidis DSM 10068 TaxID=1123282 RepID=A0A1M5XST1_9FIRM|nr:histidine kinase N-terminal 7TM domain-containing protein [Sporobacter termitidis]SHI02323.1 Signal transduction histidine kinase [Sporobacter termitidis DSM 10068]